jgi:hypothetical protein
LPDQIPLDLAGIRVYNARHERDCDARWQKDVTLSS